MIAVYPTKRQGLPARCCIDCQTTKGKMLELQAGDVENKTVLVLCEKCAEIVARQIMRETAREAREGVWLQQAGVDVPLVHDSDSHKVVVSPVRSFIVLPEKNQYAVFILNKKDGDWYVVAEALIDPIGRDNAAFKTQQQAIDAYLGASQKYSESDAEVKLHRYNAFVRQM